MTDQRHAPPAGSAKPALLRAWENTLRRHAGRTAVVEAASGETCTFRELDTRCRAWEAKHITNPAQLRGRSVVFALPNGIRWFEVLIALIRCEAVAVPLDGAEPPAAQRRHAEALRAAYWLDGDTLVALPHARSWRAPSPSLIKLTSGTTGTPRPLAFTAAQLLADARHVTATMGIRARDLNHALIPLGHSYGLGNLTLPLLAHGVPLVCGSSPLPHAIAADLARWRATVFPTVPAVLRALVASDIAHDAFRDVRTVISAGAPLPMDVAREFAARFGRPVHSFYGSSETGGIAYDRTGKATLAGGVGTPLRGVVITPRAAQRLEVSSPAVFTLGNRRRRGGHGVWLPPDRASVDARGQLTLLGRRGTVVKIAGRRVNLVEIERRLRQVAGVREAWVGVSGGVDPLLGAAIVGSRGVVELRTELLADTAPWKIPKRWAILPALPLTARGKTDAHALHAAVFR